MTTHHRTCNLCEANCGILIETDGPSIVSIRGDDADPLSEGYICPKAYALKDLYADPDRIRRPMIRDGADWREVGWEEAIQVAARGIFDVQKAHGPSGVASYVGNPTVHNLAASLGVGPWLRALGSRVRFSASSVDQFPKMLSSYLLFGAQLAVPVPDVDRTDYLLTLGGNPLVSNGSLMTAPGMKRRLRALKARGGKLVVLDPRRSETAAVADEHVFVRPGTDPLFLAALVHVMFRDGLVDRAAVSESADGVDLVEESTAPFSPSAVADATGVSASAIERIAHEFCDAPSSVCYTRIGVCVSHYGTLSSYLGDLLNLLAGRLDRIGGAMFPNAAAAHFSSGSYRRWTSRVRGLPEFGGELPVATMAEEIETPGQGQVRGLFTMAGNPVLSTPNGTRLDGAFASLDFMVSVDPALNETTRHAHVLLPPRSALENPQYSLAFHNLAVRDTAKLTAPVFPAAEDSWSEWEILGALARELHRLRVEQAVEDGVDPPADKTRDHFAVSPEQIVGMLLDAGPYDVDLEALRGSPSGVDLGPLKEGGLSRAVRHEGGRVRLVHDVIDRELVRLGEDLDRGFFALAKSEGEGPTDNAFLLIGRRQLRTNNSWMHNCPSLMKGPERCTLLMHPSDASRLGLIDGRTVAVASRVGGIELPLAVTEDVMPGIVSMPHGFGHSRSGVRMQVAQEKPGASMNDLTDEQVTEGLVGNAVLTGVPVRVSAREIPFST